MLSVAVVAREALPYMDFKTYPLRELGELRLAYVTDKNGSNIGIAVIHGGELPAYVSPKALAKTGLDIDSVMESMCSSEWSYAEVESRAHGKYISCFPARESSKAFTAK